MTEGKEAQNNTEESQTSQNASAQESEENRPPGWWMVRSCETYEDEYKECKRFKSRFHQYFIFGDMVDCTPWKRDLDNCLLYRKFKSQEAYNKLIESEKIRRQERLKGHVMNDVWEKRESPPTDWNKPLPEWMQKELENSYLYLKSIEVKEHGIRPSSTCTIL